MSKGPESLLTGKILLKLREIPGSWWTKIHGGRFKAGIPDIVGCHHGKFVAIEVKSPHTEHGLTKLQGHVLEQIHKAGGLCGVAYSVEDAWRIACPSISR